MDRAPKVYIQSLLPLFHRRHCGILKVTRRIHFSHLRSVLTLFKEKAHYSSFPGKTMFSACLILSVEVPGPWTRRFGHEWARPRNEQPEMKASIYLSHRLPAGGQCLPNKHGNGRARALAKSNKKKAIFPKFSLRTHFMKGSWLIWWEWHTCSKDQQIQHVFLRTDFGIARTLCEEWTEIRHRRPRSRKTDKACGWIPDSTCKTLIRTWNLAYKRPSLACALKIWRLRAQLEGRESRTLSYCPRFNWGRADCGAPAERQ